MIGGHADNQDRLQLIRAGFDEIQGLSLTKLQMQRLWDLDHTTCGVLLETLEAAMFLRRTPDNMYVKVSAPNHAAAARG
jgi:hypothetical protein